MSSFEIRFWWIQCDDNPMEIKHSKANAILGKLLGRFSKFVEIKARPNAEPEYRTIA